VFRYPPKKGKNPRTALHTSKKSKKPLSLICFLCYNISKIKEVKMKKAKKFKKRLAERKKQRLITFYRALLVLVSVIGVIADFVTIIGFIIFLFNQ
jgi:hypothetical protein